MKISNLRNAAGALRTHDDYRLLRSRATFAILVAICLITSVGLVFATEDDPIRTSVTDLTSISVASLPAPREGSRILASDGTELALLIGPEKRTVVRLDQISQVMIDTLLAVEDRRFFFHRGIDLRGLARAASTDLKHGEIREGGSTITQQYVKNTYLESKRTFGRKVEEIGLALAVEQAHSKEKILEAYLNTAYFGEGVYGVEASSQFYFSTPASELRPEQAALLVSILPSPNDYSPIANPKLSLKLRNLVLAKMATGGVITSSDAQTLKATPIAIVPQKTVDIKMAPYFVEYVKQSLLDDVRLGKTPKERYDSVFGGGLIIKTSLDAKLQAVVDRAAIKLPRGVPESAVVVMDHSNGNILAYHGGGDFDKNKFDLVSQGRRQPGSAFKTFALVAALQQNYSPSLGLSGSSPCVNRANKFDAPWKVRNFANSSFGGVSLRTATHKSINCAFAQLVTKYIKPTDVEDTAHSMGITS
ncbi:MAG: transglycosylase domain-containing protein, partial [Actinomycetota bacterium]